MHFRLMIISVLCVLSNLMISQNPREITFTQNDGLPSNNVYKAIQDNEGYMWFCTDKGISKFDGYYFKNFTIEDGLPYNDIYNLHLDAQGKIWLATFDRICYIENDSIYEVDLPEGYSFSGVTKHYFSQNKENHLIRFVDDRFEYLDLVNGKLVVKKNLEQQKQKSTMLKIDNSGEILYYLGSPDSINQIRHIDNGKIQYDKFQPNGIYRNIAGVQNITIDDKRILFLQDSIYVLQTDKINSFSYRDIFNQDLKPKFFTCNDDLILFRSTAQTFILDADLNILDGYEFFNDRSVNSFYVDSDQNIWVCSGDGVTYIFNNPGYSKNFALDSADENERFKSISTDSKGKLFLSSQNGNVYSFSQDKGFQKYLNSDLTNLDKIYFNFSENESYLADFNEGVLRSSTLEKVRLKQFKLNELVIVENKIRDNNVNRFKLSYKDMAVAENGNMVICHSQGATMFTQDSILQIFNKRSYAAAFRKDEIWLGTLKGLYKLSNGKESLMEMNGEFPYVNGLKIDKKDNLWISTNGNGLWKYNGDQFMQIEGTEELLISNFYVYAENEIWLATNSGMHSVKAMKGEEGYKLRKYGRSDGFASQSIVDVYADDKNIYALSSNYLSVLNKQEKLAPSKSAFSFTGFKVNGETTRDLTNLSFRAKENNIEINYKTLLLPHLGNLSYEWKMEGLNNEWTSTTNTNQLFYELDPGDYDFQVRTFDSNNSEIGEVQNLPFEIRKPWFNALWFYILMGLLILAIWNLISSQKNKRNRIKAEIETEMQKEFYELRLKAIQAQLNPHFVFNALNSIQKYIYEKQPEEANQYLVKFAKLMRAILDSTSKNYVFLREEIDLLKMYVSLEKLRFDDHFDYEIKIDEALMEQDVKLPSTLIQPFIENAINHGIALKEDKAHLLIQVEQQGEDMIWIIQDNGVGREEAKKRRQSNHISRAMTILKERKEILKQRDNLDLDFSFVDLIDEKGKGIGTKVIIKIPLDFET